MKKAYESLKRKGKIKKDISIETTHLYVRIYDLTPEEFDYCLVKNPMELFTHPLDYELNGKGVYLPESGVSCLYSVVPVTYDFGKIKYEVIEKCCVPDQKSDDNLLAVEEESIRMSGASNNANSPKRANSGGNPKGYIKVYDTKQKKLVPVQKVKVRVWKFMRIATTYTSESGYYYIGTKFLTDPYYSVSFENATGFKIWGNLIFLAPATYSYGSRSKNGYSANMYLSASCWRWATINNAAYYYREKLCPSWGITKPIGSLRIWDMRMSGNWGGSTPMLHNITTSPALIASVLSVYSINVNMGAAAAVVLALLHFVLPDMFILNKDNLTEKITSTVLHESAHASHYVKGGRSYWAQYITQIVANNGYGDEENNNNGIIGVGEMWGNFAEYIAINTYYSTTEFAIDNRDWMKPRRLKRIHEEIPNASVGNLFNCLTSDITNLSLLKAKLKNVFGTYHGIDYRGRIDEIFAEG